VQGRQAFDAGFQRADGTTVVRFEVDQNPHRIQVDATARVPLMFARFLDRNGVRVRARAQVPLDDVTVEVALVLDNTGSMGSSGKMTALQTASKNLVTKLQNASVVNTNAFVALVPFATQVRLPPLPVTTPPTPPPSWVRLNHAKDRNEPKLVVNGIWQGCIADRDQPYDIQATPPNSALVDTLYPAANCDVADLAPLMPLNRRFNRLRTEIDAMQTSGDTNGAIGLAMGLALLTPNADMDTGAKQGRFVKKHIIFLTDGENTRNRWSNGQVQIDQRTDRICTEIKQSSYNIVLHTILLMQGNATLLQNCATSRDRYHFVTTPSQLDAVFDAIASELLSVRLAN
jgi:Mg-chelatase subunit ChlD